MFWLLALILQGSNAFAYPEMVRHGYFNCVACHVSPNGGGMLNAYGRSMSREVLSVWGSERESEVLHGALPAESLPESVLFGGDVRHMQVHRESPDRKTGRSMLMQAQFDVGLRVGAWTGVISLGEAKPANDSVRWVSPHHYLMWNAQEQLSLRAGRFTPVFGIPIAYHTLPTRQSMGLGPNGDRHTAEMMWSGETWNFAATSSRTAPERIPIDQRETMLTAQVNRSFDKTYRIGLSALQGSTSQLDREAWSVHGILGFSHKLSYLTEFTWQRTQAHTGSHKNALYHFSQLIYEPTRGVQLYLLEDYGKSNVLDSRTLKNSIGPGLRFYPRPHFEFDLVFLKVRTVAVSDRYDDLAWLVSHYYF